MIIYLSLFNLKWIILNFFKKKYFWCWFMLIIKLILFGNNTIKKNIFGSKRRSPGDAFGITYVKTPKYFQIAHVFRCILGFIFVSTELVWLHWCYTKLHTASHKSYLPTATQCRLSFEKSDWLMFIFFFSRTTC